MAAKHWRKAYGRIWREATEAVGLGTAPRMIGFCVVQAIISLGVYFWLGQAGLANAAPTRVLTALAPFAAVPLLLFWRLVAAPAALTEEVEKHAAPVDEPLPDMTLRELFFHIDPNVVEDFEDSTPLTRPWVVVGGKVQDAFSLGRLRCWGRRTGRGSAQRKGKETLQEIDRSVWVTGAFSYQFFPEDAERISHFIGSEGVDQPFELIDLRVNRAQALKVWPSRP